MLRLERSLDPRSPRFEDASLRSNGGGKFSKCWDYDAWLAHAAAKCGIGTKARFKIWSTGAPSKPKLAVVYEGRRMMATRVKGGFDERDTCLETEAIHITTYIYI